MPGGLAPECHLVSPQAGKITKSLPTYMWPLSVCVLVCPDRMSLNSFRHSPDTCSLSPVCVSFCVCSGGKTD
ncbi:hypothetical protein FKM82_017960 [Ascaphus truei]